MYTSTQVHTGINSLLVVAWHSGKRIGYDQRS